MAAVGTLNLWTRTYCNNPVGAEGRVPHSLWQTLQLLWPDTQLASSGGACSAWVRNSDECAHRPVNMATGHTHRLACLNEPAARALAALVAHLAIVVWLRYPYSPEPDVP